MPHFEMSKAPAPFEDKGLIFVKDGNLFLYNESNYQVFFTSKELQLDTKDKNSLIYIGQLEDQPIFALERKGLSVPNASYVSHILTLDALSLDVRQSVLRGCQLLNWNNKSNFCGCCGAAMQAKQNEFVKRCSQNEQHLSYPQYSPAIVVLIKSGDEFLLGRSPSFRKGVYSTLAGFIEAGESAEDAVKREVMEEVGVEVTNIRIVSTSAWPFPNSFMIAFEADAVSKNLKIDPKEIEDAQWYKYNNLPPLPVQSTISYWLIQHGVKQCEQALKLQQNAAPKVTNGKITFLACYAQNAFYVFSPQYTYHTQVALRTLGQSLLHSITNQALTNWYTKPGQTLSQSEQLSLSAASGALVGLLLCLSERNMNWRLLAMAYEQSSMSLCTLGAYPIVKLHFSGKSQSNESGINLKAALMTSGLYLGLSIPLAVNYINTMRSQPNVSHVDKIKMTMVAARSLFFKAPVVAASAVLIESHHQSHGLSKL